MTESDWAKCEKPGPMLAFLRKKTSDRKFRLFACACCRSIQHVIPTGPCRTVLEVSLHFADGDVTADDLAQARTAALAVADKDRARYPAAWAACETANPSAYEAAVAAVQWIAQQVHRIQPQSVEEEAQRQAGFLRDIIGNPFREVRAPSLRRAITPRVEEIAADLYEGGPQDSMKDLADELERQGCNNADVLNHCRSPELHVCGCWVLDRILGFEIEPEEEGAEEFVQPAEKLPPGRAEEIRAAFATFLGPKQYRRAVRLALAMSPAQGIVGRPAFWENFARLHPQYQLSDAGLTEVLAVCTLHGCGLINRTLRAPWDASALLSNDAFVHARSTQFPYSHPEESDGEWETRVWFCPECQRLREAWITEQPRP